MSIQLDMKERMKDAMRAKDSVRLGVIRAIISSFTNESINLGKGPAGELSDEEALAVIRRESKKRKDSIEQYTNGGRPELAETEAAELAIINEFLPTLMSEDQVRPIVEAKKAELGVTDKSGAGQLMKAVMTELKGKADGSTVKAVVDKLLA